MTEQRKNESYRKPRRINVHGGKYFRIDELKKYPGGEIIVAGLNDINRGIYDSTEALALFIASPRLNEAGFGINENTVVNPNLLLYKLMCNKYGNEAHYQYNSFMARVAKFCNHFNFC